MNLDLICTFSVLQICVEFVHLFIYYLIFLLDTIEENDS